MMIHFKTITIVGVGLIGGSFARVCKNKKLADRIIGFGRDEKNLKRAVGLNVIDSYSLNLRDAVSNSDFIILATRVFSIIKIAREMMPYLKKGAIVTDAGSVKGEIVREIDEILSKEIFFVGAHPIAGTEKSGVEASFVELFEGHKCVITPTDKTNSAALEKVKEIWSETGSEVILMDADKHDRYLAAVSHLPHAVAYALVNAVGGLDEKEKGVLSFSAGGFRDFTRIAASHPAMWRDIFLMNKKNVVDMISLFQSTLENIKKAIINDDGEDITSKIRDEEVGNGASIVSAYSGVRNAMLIKQREIGKSGGVVMEGRDIGTVIFPNANIKFFLAASAEERGRRRHLELEEKGENVERDRIVEDIRKRDNKDASREIAPLRRADDSIVIDTTGISIDEVVENMLQEIDKHWQIADD